MMLDTEDKEKLKYQLRTASKEHRDAIARRVGGQWESLATFIGVPAEDVSDIKCEYTEQLQMRLAMIEKWYQLLGSKATYLKLIGGLRQIGRADLIEELISWSKLSDEPRSARLTVSHNHDTIILLAIIIAVLFAFGFIIISDVVESSSLVSKRHFYNNNSKVDNDWNASQRYFSVESKKSYQGDEACNHRLLTNSDVPTSYQEVFVGRANDMQELLHKVARANIVNINGAPGFGKSTLAIHVGDEMLKNGTLVQYVNVDEKLSPVYYNTALKDSATKHGKTTKSPARNTGQVHKSDSLVDFRSSSSSSLSLPHLWPKNEQNLFIDELISWSEAIICNTVLILDNCDDMLISSSRDEFIHLMNLLVRKSQFNLHIIVTSREKLLFLNQFDSWTVRELNQSASIQLLEKLAPGISTDQLKEVSELIEGYPLALKVVGQLLHLNGAQLTYKLKKELIRVLDQASNKQERFRAIMEVAFRRLGKFEKCGYILSLFPGSFDKNAGNAVMKSSPDEDCLELHVKYSLLDEYFLPQQNRYKMHKLIREFLKEKLHSNDHHRFKLGFRKYYVDMLLMCATKWKSGDDYQNILSEMHNIHHLKTILMKDIVLSFEELSALAFLLNVQNINIVEVKELEQYYALYMKEINNVCQILDLDLCGKLYSHIMIHLYSVCKCETLSSYWNNFFHSPCMEHFQCSIMDCFRELEVSGVLIDFPGNVKDFIYRIGNYHCGGTYFQDNISIGAKVFVAFKYGVLFLIWCFGYLKLSLHTIILWDFPITVCALLFRIVRYTQEFGVTVVLQPIFFEVILKRMCHSSILCCIALPSIKLLAKYRNHYPLFISILGAISAFIVLIGIYYFHTTKYCCQFLPICQ